MFHRRSFLKQVGVGASALALPGRGRAAASWGQLPDVACCAAPWKILEIFCYGGMSQWEHFWVSHDGPSGGLNWRGAGDDVGALDWSGCDGAPTSNLQTHDFAVAGGTTAVSWGPATKKMWPFLDRCRMAVIRPGSEAEAGVHALDIHKALTGLRLGNPRAAGLGAAIARRHLTLAPQQTPYSYVLAPHSPGLFSYVGTYAAAAGAHPAAATPLALKIGGGNFSALLARPGATTAQDAVVQSLRAQYQRMLRWKDGTMVRSPAFSAYEAASSGLHAAPALQTLLPSEAFDVVSDAICVEDPAFDMAARSNTTRRSLQIAGQLFSKGGARHITVIDGGLERVEGDAPYDTHGNTGSYNHAQVSSGNLWNVLSALADIIQPQIVGRAPTGLAVEQPRTPLVVGTPTFGGKIDLDSTVVVIHTEFARTPYRVNFGRNHGANSGHLAIMFGGPFQGSSIAGMIDLDDGEPESAVPASYFTSVDLRAALLRLATIDPFADGNLRISDGFGPLTKPLASTTAAQVLDNIESKFLGL